MVFVQPAFNDTSPSGTASIATPAGVNGFHAQISATTAAQPLLAERTAAATAAPGLLITSSLHLKIMQAMFMPVVQLIVRLKLARLLHWRWK